MKKIILICLVCLLVGCNTKDSDVNNNKTKINYIKVNNQINEDIEGAYIVEIDGCEYINQRTYGGYRVYTHKGNCKYCTERLKQMLSK